MKRVGDTLRMLARIEAVAERSTPLILALQSLLGSLQLLDALHIWYHPTIHRATRTMRFEPGFSLIAPLSILLLLWLVCVVRRKPRAALLPAAALLISPSLGVEAALSAASLLAAAGGLWVFRRPDRYLFWLLLFLSGLEAASLLHWAVYVPLGLAGPFEPVARLELDLFYVAVYLAPLLVLPLLFMWALKPLIRWGWREKAEDDIKRGAGLPLTLRSAPLIALKGRRFDREYIDDAGKFSPRLYLFLFFTISLGVAAALYPYMSAVNPQGLNVGVDIPAYVKVGRIVERDVSQVFNVSRDRPLIYLAIYGFQQLIGSDVSTAVRLLPVILNPLLALSAFFLAWEVFGDGWISAWASFFTVCGFPITVGMYSYFLTNMLGLCLVFFSLGSLFRALRRASPTSLAIASLLGSLLVFTHPWTFDHFYAAATLTAAWASFEAWSSGGREEARTILLYLTSLGIAELLKALVFRGYGGVSASSTVVNRLSGLTEFWYGSIFSFRLLYGGFMSNLVLIGLAILGVHLLERRGLAGVYFKFFMLVTSLVFLVGDETIKSRLLYNVPVGLFAACGFLSILRREELGATKYLFALFVTLSLLVYLLRSMANLV